MQPPGVVPGRHLLNFRRSGRATSRSSYSGTNLLHRFALLGQSEEEDDSPDTQEESQTLLRVPPAWITATPCGITCSKMKPANCITLCAGALFCPTARRFPGDVLNRQREAFMTRWIGWGCSKMMATYWLSAVAGTLRHGKDVARMPSGN